MISTIYAAGKDVPLSISLGEMITKNNLNNAAFLNSFVVVPPDHILKYDFHLEKNVLESKKKEKLIESSKPALDTMLQPIQTTEPVKDIPENKNQSTNMEPSDYALFESGLQQPDPWDTPPTFKDEIRELHKVLETTVIKSPPVNQAIPTANLSSSGHNLNYGNTLPAYGNPNQGQPFPTTMQQSQNTQNPIYGMPPQSMQPPQNNNPTPYYGQPSFYPPVNMAGPSNEAQPARNNMAYPSSLPTNAPRPAAVGIPAPNLPPRTNKGKGAMSDDSPNAGLQKQLMSKGHGMEVIGLAIEAFPDDSQKASMFASFADQFLNKGAKKDLIRSAILLYDHDSTWESKSKEYIQSYLTLKEFGFEENAIKEALLLTEAKCDMALDYLTNDKK